MILGSLHLGIISENYDQLGYVCCISVGMLMWKKTVAWFGKQQIS